MKKILDYVRTFIYLIMCMLFTILIYMYLGEIFIKSTKTYPLCIFLIICIVLTAYFSRKYIKNLILFFLIHIALIVFSILIPSNIMNKIILAAISLTFLLMAINFWKTDSNERHLDVIDIPFGAIIIFIGIYFHSTYCLSNVMTRFSYIGGISYFMLYFIREYLEKFFSYSMSSENFSNELKSTFKTSFSLVALFNIAVILVITAINMCISNNSFNIIGRFIKWLAKAFFSLFARFKGENVVNETVTTAFVEQDTSVGDTLIANNSHSSGTNIGTLIFNAFQIVIYIGLVIGILFIIYTFIKQYMHRNTETKDEIKDTNDVINKININKKPSASKPSFFGTNKDKIRKIFVAKVHSSTKKNNSIIIKKSYTSDEIENALLKEASVEKTNMNKLTSLYKEARYSNHEITKSDVEEAKKVSTWLE